MASRTRLNMTMDLSGLKRLQRISPAKFRTAMEKGGVQFLNWANNGSIREPRKPPIRWGVLRGSSSVFRGNKLVAIFAQPIRTGGGEVATPAMSHSAGDLTLTFVWNTSYATRMHMHAGNWGKFTKADGDAGNMWLEKHLESDKEDLLLFIRKKFQQSVGIE